MKFFLQWERIFLKRFNYFFKHIFIFHINNSSSGKSQPIILLCKFIHNKKTSALIESSILAGGFLAKANDREINALRKYGKAIGLCFQIRDDILDEIGDNEKLGKNVGSDQSNNKLTYLTLHGLEKSIKKTHELYEQAVESLDVFGQDDILFFKEFANYLVYRES